MVASNGLGSCDYIGKDNVFDLDSPTFIDDISNRAVAILNGEAQPQQISDDLSWEKTAITENTIYAECMAQSEK